MAVERLHGTACRLAVPNIERTECLKSWLRSNVVSGKLVAIDSVAEALDRGALIEQSCRSQKRIIKVGLVCRLNYEKRGYIYMK